MATKVMIPRMGQKETSGTMGMWFKKEGEKVGKGSPLCTIETKKASVEIEAPCSGVLRRILCPEDSEVSEGDYIAIIGEPEEDITELEREIQKGK